MKSIVVLFVSLGLLLVSCAHQPDYGLRGDAYDSFPLLLERHASRAQCERAMKIFYGKPVRVNTPAELLAARPPVPPTPEVLALLKRRGNATYAQMECDCRVLACFDKHGRLFAYEIF